MNQEFRELHLKKVSRSFGGAASVAALNELQLTVQRGEFISLLGPSGCGKSTALNCIAGLLPVTGGSIWLDDDRIDQLPPEKRGFGMVFQNYALFPHMTVRQNVGFGLKMRNVDTAEIDRRVTKALDLVQLGRHVDKLPGQLSGGQQQRVAIARAIVIEPPLILMDEPLSNLDAKLRLEMRAEIRRIHRELGRATIYVTHDQDEALSLSDRIVVMKDGVPQQIASPKEVYSAPSNLHVARFMGYRNVLAMNAERLPSNQAKLSGHQLSLVGTFMEQVPGQNVSVALRPEEMRVVDAPGDNTFSARVESIEYCGRDYILEVVTPGGTRLIVRTPETVQANQQIYIHIPADRVLVYGAEHQET